MIIGELKEIVRHPIKSFRGENVQQTYIASYGLYGDRSHAFLDETRPGKYLTATQLPEMIGYTASFIGKESLDIYPPIKIISPEGKIYKWGDQELLKELEQKSNRQIEGIQYSPQQVPLGAIEEEHVLIVTDTSLQKMSNLWGQDVNHRRFRPNLIFSLYENIPFAEDTWFGKCIRIVEVELEIVRHCERCMIITIDPNTLTLETTLLKTIVQKRNNHFGVYASVIKPGKVNIGDSIVLK
ncbi:MOSC domain-containing protein [Bacillus toyonensis]|uniref:MOSC domain-containing protein n=1 Tax=Bacillus toyonensis TaxID=155322 RepID=UPI000BEF5DA5|nr:MOSC N-terminal beta barrel domain-containing protein [Bacillus toyonensis]PEO51838.1 MOSC domain-containing protein [Bacillus toyonensis]